MTRLGVLQARQVGNDAGVVVTSDDPDGAGLGARTWPGIWIVTCQRPVAGVRVRRSDAVVIEFYNPGGGGAGDREPRDSPSQPPRLTMSLSEPDPG